MQALSFPLFKFATLCLLPFALSTPLEAATLIYYDGEVSGNTVINKGTLLTTGDGTIVANGTGTVTAVADGGPGGNGDAYYNFAHGATGSNGAWINAPAAALPNFRNTSWSVSGFFNRTGIGNSEDSIVHFGNGDMYGGENELYLFGAGGSTSTRLERYAPGATLLTTTADVGKWYSYALTFSSSGLNDGTGTLTLYMNGTVVGSSTNFNFSTGGNGDGGLAQLLQVGGIGVGNQFRAFHGGIDEFAFYDTVLTQAEVTGLSDGSITPLDVIPEPSRALLLMMSAVGFCSLRVRRRVRDHIVV